MFSQQQRQRMLEVARESMRHGCQHGEARQVTLDDFPVMLQQPGACFVTLHDHGQLSGCIGSLEARRPLIEDVSENAYAAAFRDPRFAPLRIEELPAIDISISVLSAAEEMTFSSEQDLRQQLQPGIDGLILKAGFHKGTFLPAVWEQLPRPEDFLSQLKRKAGLSENYWADSVKISRYHTESFAESSLC